MMGKKKKKKGAAYDIVDLGYQLLKNGQLKFKKDCIISMEEISKPSIDNTLGSRVDVLEDHPEVSTDNAKILQINGNCGTIERCFTMISKIGTDDVPTIVTTLPWKKAVDGFAYQGGIISYLCRISNLLTIFNAVKENWRNLLEDSTGMDCILFIPEITVLLDDRADALLEKNQKKVNLLLYVTKKKHHIYDDEEVFGKQDDNHSDAYKLIQKMLECAVRLNCKHLIVDPFCHPVLTEDVRDTTDAWVELTAEDRVTEHIKVIDFTIDDDNLYIIFWKARKPLHRDLN